MDPRLVAIVQEEFAFVTSFLRCCHIIREEKLKGFVSSGPCGKTKNLIKTPRCDNWICDDMHEYVAFSYATNSCYRNHDRYTLCSYHYHENHPGNWQNCEKCKDAFEIENHADFGTNDFNFEKLTNPPEILIKCANCNFQSNSAQDFAFQTSKGWYCDKKKCQEAAMKF